MIKLSGMQRFLATWTKRQAGEIDQRTRPLRNAGMLSAGPRGDYAPEITIPEAVYILASMVSRRASNAFDVAQVFMSSCRYVEHPRHSQMMPAALAHGTQAALFLTLCLTESSPFDVHCFEISEDGERAWMMIWVNGQLEILHFSSEPDAVRELVGGNERIYRNQGSAILGSRFVIGGAILSELALKLLPEEGARYAAAGKAKVLN